MYSLLLLKSNNYKQEDVDQKLSSSLHILESVHDNQAVYAWLEQFFVVIVSMFLTSPSILDDCSSVVHIFDIPVQLPVP